MLVIQRPIVRILDLVEQIRRGGGRGRGGPHRHGVDHQTDHLVGAGDVGRAARHRGPEHDVVPARQLHEQLCVGALQDDVDGGVARPRQLGDSLRGFGRQRNGFHPAASRCGPCRDQGRRVDAGQHLGPRGARRIEIALGQPCDEPAVRHRGGQPVPVIAGEDLAQQDRQ
ncbi:Uncharacterised protein [Mycobacteroides abscessus subsp. abscessus]|nr:Uncharacterised protein [Mycobacteroides abscessus subsp. abscessus]